MKAIEAARRAIEAHPAYDCGSTGDQEMAEAAIRAYLTALSEDDAAVEAVARAIHKSTLKANEDFIDETGWGDKASLKWHHCKASYMIEARAAIRAMGADHD